MVTETRVAVFQDHVRKTYATAQEAGREVMWYRQVPWATPRLLAFSGRTLHIERCVPAIESLDRRDPDGLFSLLLRLQERRIHHRDLHIRNVVFDGEGFVRLIDWEHAIRFDSAISYDIHGAARSGVPISPTCLGKEAWSWDASPRTSIRNYWGCDVSAQLEQRKRGR
jgi:Ser/Thr protein kinase RdoA (MazF antagonist)